METSPFQSISISKPITLFWIAIELTVATSSVWKYNETAPVVIIGGYGQPSGLIFASLNESDGSLTAFNGPFDVGANPSTLTVNQQTKYNMIYTVNEVDGNGGRVVTAPFDPSNNYSIDPQNIVSQSSFGGTPAFISHDLSMTFVYIANYGSGDINSSFAIFKINQKTGYLSDQPIVYKTFDTSATVSHIHCIVPNPNDLFHFYVADLGRNVVEHYRMNYNAKYDAYSVTLMSSLAFQGSGPRTFAYNPVMNGILYVSQEAKSQVSVLTFDVDSHELLQVKQTLSSLHKANGSDNAQQNVSEWGTSHVRCDNEGKYLYVANRVTNTIASFTIDPTNGLLIADSMHLNECKGVVPRHFSIDTKNEYMLVCNQEWGEGGKGANVVSFKIDHNNGGHLNFVSKFDTGRPTWAYIITPSQDDGTNAHNASHMVLIIGSIVIVIILVLITTIFVKKRYEKRLKKDDDNYKMLLN